MLHTVLQYLSGGGTALLDVVRIAAGQTALQTAVTAIEEAVTAQDMPTTGVTHTREEVKAEAAEKAEVLRLLVLVLSPDATLRAHLKTPLSKVAHGKDEVYLQYLNDIVQAIGTLSATELAEAGYKAAVLNALQADLTQLEATQGAARQIQVGTSTATEQLPGLLAAADAVLTDTLDPLVRAQALALPTEVAGYERARRIQHTAARRRPRFSGGVLPQVVTLVYDRREAGLVDPTLSNRSGRGRYLRYYTAALPTAEPLPGQGVVVKHRSDVHLDNYARLGPDAEAPYLLVVLEGIDGEGHYLVQ